MNSIQKISAERKANNNLMYLGRMIEDAFNRNFKKKIQKRIQADINKARKENDEADKELEAHFTEEWINVGDSDHDDWMKIPCTCHSVSNLQNDDIPF